MSPTCRPVCAEASCAKVQAQQEGAIQGSISKIVASGLTKWDKTNPIVSSQPCSVAYVRFREQFGSYGPPT